jgi:rare lipoprotein A
MMLRPFLVRLLAGLSVLALPACSADHYGGKGHIREMPASGARSANPAVAGPEPGTREPKPTLRQEGEASYYGARFQGRLTASGEPFDKNALTAASPTLPLGAKAKVTNKETGKSVHVEVTDRMPPTTGRVIDLSERAAKQVGLKESGTAPVRIEVKRPYPGAP